MARIGRIICAPSTKTAVPQHTFSGVYIVANILVIQIVISMIVWPIIPYSKRGGPSRLQSTRLVAAVAELGALGVTIVGIAT